MRAFEMCDLPFDQMSRYQYDAALFTASEEDRCLFIPGRLSRQQVVTPVVLRPSGGTRGNVVEGNATRLSSVLGAQPVDVDVDDESALYELLDDLVPLRPRDLRLLVDYSSMPRAFYAGVLNWATYSSAYRRVVVDFVYAISGHKPVGPPLAITDIRALPGCDGSAVPFSNSVAVLGLGFDGIAALAVLERLEPDTLYTYYAAPGAFPDYPEKTRMENRDILAYYSMRPVPVPLHSVARTMARLAELVAPHRGKEDLTLVPMGPKPHVLAAILLSMAYKEISCLHVTGKVIPPRAEGITGKVIGTRVVFETEAVSPEAEGVRAPADNAFALDRASWPLA